MHSSAVICGPAHPQRAHPQIERFRPPPFIVCVCVVISSVLDAGLLFSVYVGAPAGVTQEEGGRLNPLLRYSGLGVVVEGLVVVRSS